MEADSSNNPRKCDFKKRKRKKFTFNQIKNNMKLIFFI